MTSGAEITMPTLEGDALRWIAKHLRLPRGAVIDRARLEYLTAGSPRVRVPGYLQAQFVADQQSQAVYAAVRWWLRRSPALELLAPSRLAIEFIEAARADDWRTAEPPMWQLVRIAIDQEHSLHAAACELLQGCVPDDRWPEVQARLTEWRATDLPTSRAVQA